MKWSKYNHITHSGSYGIFIYNSVTNSLIRIDPELMQQIENVRDWSSEIKNFDQSFSKKLLDNKIIVDDKFDDEVFYKKNI